MLKGKNRFSVEIRAAQIEPALRTLQLAATLAQLRGTVGTVLCRIGRLGCRPTPAIVGWGRLLLLSHYCCALSRNSREILNYAARSEIAADVRLQQSARMSQAPSLRHTFTYLPRSVTGVPSALRTTKEKRPSSMAISPE